MPEHSAADVKLASAIIADLYRRVLDRDADPEGLERGIGQLLELGFEEGVGIMIYRLQDCDEYRNKQRRKWGAGQEGADGEAYARNNGPFFRTPRDLAVSATPLRRALFLGACVLDTWPDCVRSLPEGCESDHVLFNYGTILPAQPPVPASEYDFQVISLPLRSVLPEQTYLKLSYLDLAGHEALLREACERAALMLSRALRWNIENGLLTFVTGFFSPQQNPMGRLLPRHDLRNLAYMIEQINASLEQQIAKYDNVHYVDLGEIASTFGRKLIQDDFVCVNVHGSLLNNFDFEQDQKRIVPLAAMDATYQTCTENFVTAVWSELVSMFRTVRGIDAVKLVVVDLDDTLWKGIAAEADQLTGHEIEGWPLGVIESLMFLKKRGVMLGVVSKNSRELIERIWDTLTKNTIALDDFAFVHINWNDKTENFRALLQAANVLPDSVVFIDDNPVERAAVQEAFPDIRVIGAEPYHLKRLLLWSSETQIVAVTDEAARRTEMMQSRRSAEAVRQAVPREEFLRSLAVKVSATELSSTSAPGFARCFELINKTNQFNTTGRRWTHEAMTAFLEGGGEIFSFAAEDRYSRHGIVAVLLARGSLVEQFVMSCRVFGLDVERKALAHVMAALSKRGREISARLIETPANFPCRQVYQEAGFARAGELWTRRIDDEEALALQSTDTLEPV